MDIIVLNSELEKIAIVDSFTSLICCKRYYDIGALDLQIEATTENIEYFQRGNYIIRSDGDDSVYRIEAVELDTTTGEEEDFLIVGGYDIKKILAQRVVWNLTNFKGTVEAYIRKLITDAIINPTVNSRKISNFAFAHNADPVKFPETISEQVTYDNLAEKIIEICKTYGFGWKVTLSNGNFLFDLFRGTDKSIGQPNSVIFSPDFENLINSKYTADGSEFSNVALVAGEGEGESRTRYIVGESEGLKRFELYVDANNISSDTEDPNFNYEEALESKGNEELAKVSITTSFNGEIDNTSYKYKTDYDIGDVVSLKNEYGIGVNARITEITETWDTEGYTIEPVFDEFAELNSKLNTPHLSISNIFDGKKVLFTSSDMRIAFHYTVGYNTEPADPTISSPIANSVDFSESEGSSEGTYYVKVIAVRNDEVSGVGRGVVTILQAQTPEVKTEGITNGIKVSWTSKDATTIKYKIGSGSWTTGSSYEHMTAGSITLYAKAWRDGYLPSGQVNNTVTLSALQNPTIKIEDIDGGKRLSFVSAGAEYFMYTLDGSDITEDSELLVAGSHRDFLQVTGVQNIRVKAFAKTGWLSSGESTDSFIVNKLLIPHIRIRREWFLNTHFYAWVTSTVEDATVNWTIYPQYVTGSVVANTEVKVYDEKGIDNSIGKIMTLHAYQSKRGWVNSDIIVKGPIN